MKKNHLEMQALKAIFDSRKKRCTCKFKIFELSKPNQNGAQRSRRLRNKFYSQSNCKKEAPFFEWWRFLRESKTAFIVIV